MERKTLTVKEAAEIVGISLPTMYAVTERDDFTALVQIGRRKIILPDKLYAWLDEQAGKRGTW